METVFASNSDRNAPIGQGRRHGSKIEEARGGRGFIRADVERLQRSTSAPTEPRGYGVGRICSLLQWVRVWGAGILACVPQIR